MSSTSLRRWSFIHKWTSLVCTLFLLVICLTGLPLVFRDEIQGWLDDDPPYAVLPRDAALTDLDQLVSASRQRFLGEIVAYVFVDDDEPRVEVGLAPSWQDYGDNPRSRHFLTFDARTGGLLKESGPQRRASFLNVMLNLHTDLFAGLAGELFLGAMGLLFVAAIVSGAVLYAPFARKLAFGTVRTGRSPRVKWLDLHNLIGVVTLAWAFVVGATGVMNELSTPLFALWRQTEVAAMLTPWQGKAPPAQDEFVPVHAVFDTVKRSLPEMVVASVTFPGNPFGSPHHYLVWAKGDTALTGRLFTPVLVDARSGAVTDMVRMPWYLRALEVSRPLHFGDYGGFPLKIIWVVLDLMTIVVLGTGLYLWWTRRALALPSPATRPVTPGNGPTPPEVVA